MPDLVSSFPQAPNDNPPATRSSQIAPPVATDSKADLARVAATRASKLGPATSALSPDSSIPNHERWEGAEHTYLGDHVTLHFDGVSGIAADLPLNLDNGLKLTYGQVVALGGDFYGATGCLPISDDPAPPTRFLQAYQSLAVYGPTVAEATDILEIMQIEINLVNEAVASGQQPSSVYEQLGDTLSGKWNVATGGGTKYVTDFYPFGRYLMLATQNWDHFGSHAITCYTVGHGVAMAAAAAARSIQDQGHRTIMLQRAYAMNAFADHFLTDLFSSGHMRTPRKELYKAVTPSDEGSLLSRYMHDEDCAFGLNVQNALGNNWLAYGDKRLLDAVNASNMVFVQTATQTSADEVWKAYSTGVAPTTNAALQYVADLTVLGNAESTLNPAPLFYSADGTVYRRSSINDPTIRTFTSYWLGSSTLLKLKLSPRFKHLGDAQLPQYLSTGLLQVASDSSTPYPSLVLVVSGQTTANGGGASAFGPLWTSTFPLEGAGVGGAYCVSADLMGTGQSQLFVKTTDSFCYGFDPILPGPGYSETWSIPNMVLPDIEQLLIVNRDGNDQRQLLILTSLSQKPGQMTLYATENGAAGLNQVWQGDGGGACDNDVWVVVERADTGASLVVQLFYSLNNLHSMNTFEPDVASGGFVLAWFGPDIGTPFSSIALAVNTLGRGRNCILQLEIINDAYSMYLYTPNADNVSYTNEWYGPLIGTGAFVNWFPVVNGFDDIERILLICNNNGVIGMNLYTPQNGQPGYEQTWSNANMGTFDSSGQWLTMVAGPGGENLIAQTTGGYLVTYAYDPKVGGYVIQLNQNIQVSSSYAIVASLSYDTSAQAIPD